MNHCSLRAPAIGAFLAAFAAALPSQCDARTPIVSPTINSAPWNKVCCLLIGDGRGSGHLVSPYTVLTAGHCVYSRANDRFYIVDIEIIPACVDSGGDPSGAWGSRLATRLATNTRYTNASDSDAYKYDYGAAFFDTAFGGLTVFMPLKFEYEPTHVNMSSYPCLSPAGNPTYWQFWEADSVDDITTRNIWSNVRSTSCASGAPIWTTISGSRHQVAVNRGHSTSCNSTGVRLIDANCDLIKNWLEWTPSGARAAGPGTGLPQLAGTGHLLSAEELRLMKPEADLLPQLVRARRVLQYIDGVVYDWDEFEMPRRNAEPLIAIQLRSPFAKLLDTAEAQILLSASRRVTAETPPTGNVIFQRAEARGSEPLDIPPDPAPGDIDAHRAPERAGPDGELASLPR